MPVSAAPTQLFTDAAGTLLAHPAGYGIMRYHSGRWPAAELAALLTRFGQLLPQQGWTYCLSDARLLPSLSANSKAWLAANWPGTRAVRPHPLHMALVQPAEVFARLAVAEMQAQNQGSTYYTHFADESTAHTWLAAQLALAR